MRIKLPKRFIVFGQIVRVEFAKLDLSIGGLCHPKGLIQINEELDESMVQQVLLHEFVHAVFGRVSLYQAITPEVEELIAESISKALCENFHLKPKKL